MSNTYTFKQRFLISPWLEDAPYTHSILWINDDDIGGYVIDKKSDYSFVTFFDSKKIPILTELLSPSTNLDTYNKKLAVDKKFFKFLKEKIK